jgi:hypothetical protein
VTTTPISVGLAAQPAEPKFWVPGWLISLARKTKSGVIAGVTATRAQASLYQSATAAQRLSNHLLKTPYADLTSAEVTTMFARYSSSQQLAPLVRATKAGAVVIVTGLVSVAVSSTAAISILGLTIPVAATLIAVYGSAFAGLIVKSSFDAAKHMSDLKALPSVQNPDMQFTLACLQSPESASTLTNQRQSVLDQQATIADLRAQLAASENRE